MARRGSSDSRGRDARSRAPDPVRAATKPSSSSGARSVAVSVPARSSAARVAGDVRVAPRQSSASRQSVVALARTPIQAARPVSRKLPLQRMATVPGKRSLDRGQRVAIEWNTPKGKTPGDAKRRGAKPPKSAPAQGRSTSARDKPSARSSDQRDARKAKGSAKLTDKNYKGYDATRGKPGKKEWHCKEPPKDTRPKPGGGGSKRFIPWC